MNTTSLIYQRNTYRDSIDYIYFKETPTYTTSRTCIREVHTDTATHILHHIYWGSTHRHYNVNRSYINIHSNTRLKFIICLLFYHKPHSSPWFSATCAAAIVHRNHFFHFYQENKSFESKVKFRQASNCCKRVLEAGKLAYANKTKRAYHSPETWLTGLLAIC